MMTFKELVEQGYLSEALHQELHDIIDRPEQERGSSTSAKLWNPKLNEFTKKARALIKDGQDTGMESDKPKKGSSRAVFFPTEHKPIHIDGVSTKQPTVVKIAFPGALDRYSGSSRLLGEHQNSIESDNFTKARHSVLSPDYEKGEGHYKYNEHGVTAPVLGEHPDNHWLEMGRAEKMTGKKFKELTVTDSHPKGISFKDFSTALQNDHQEAHGQHVGYDGLDHVRRHPLFRHMQDFVNETGNHPGDLREANTGVWKHPVTGKEHIVATDFGFSNDVSHLYAKAFRNKDNARDEKFKARERNYMGI